MLYLKIYKITYIVLLIVNMAFCFTTITFQGISFGTSFLFLYLHTFLLFKIWRLQLQPPIYFFEWALGLGRILMILSVGLKFGIITIVFSPVVFALWIPLFELFPLEETLGRSTIGGDIDFGSFQWVCSLLLILELIYLWMLKRNKLELRKNFHTQPSLG